MFPSALINLTINILDRARDGLYPGVMFWIRIRTYQERAGSKSQEGQFILLFLCHKHCQHFLYICMLIDNFKACLCNLQTSFLSRIMFYFHIFYRLEKIC